jgi:hypothetical protein
LPKPGTVESTQVVAEVVAEDEAEDKPQVQLAQDSLESEDEEPEVDETAKDDEPETKNEQPVNIEEVQEKQGTEPTPTTVVESKVSESKTSDSPAVVISPESNSEDDVDLKKFASVSVETEKDQDVTPVMNKKSTRSQKVLKNNDGTGSFLKVFLIGLGSFVLTVAIGVGVGYGLLQLSQPTTEPIEEPQVEWTEPVDDAEDIEEEAEEEQVEEIDRAEYSLRVVNATTRAGYAGTIASTLEEAGFSTVDAKNAAEDYEPGNYVLMEEESPELLSILSEDLDLELSFLEGYEAEDPRGDFDAVIVLGE